MRNEKGITLLILIITVIIMLILIGAGIKYGSTSLQEVKLRNFSYELQQIQGRVDSIYEKMKNEVRPDYVHLDGKLLGVNIGYSAQAVETLKNVRGINYNGANGSDENLYHEGNGRDAYYRYFSAKELEQKLDIKHIKQDVIINFKTREVISVKGQECNERTYYRLDDMK